MCVCEGTSVRNRFKTLIVNLYYFSQEVNCRKHWAMTQNLWNKLIFFFFLGCRSTLAQQYRVVHTFMHTDEMVRREYGTWNLSTKNVYLWNTWSSALKPSWRKLSIRFTKIFHQFTSKGTITTLENVGI